MTSGGAEMGRGFRFYIASLSMAVEFGIRVRWVAYGICYHCCSCQNARNTLVVASFFVLPLVTPCSYCLVRPPDTAQVVHELHADLEDRLRRNNGGCNIRSFGIRAKKSAPPSQRVFQHRDASSGTDRPTHKQHVTITGFTRRRRCRVAGC